MAEGLNKVLVTGGTGYIGTRLVTELVQRAYGSRLEAAYQ